MSDDMGASQSNKVQSDKPARAPSNIHCGIHEETSIKFLHEQKKAAISKKAFYILKRMNNLSMLTTHIRKSAWHYLEHQEKALKLTERASQKRKIINQSIKFYEVGHEREETSSSLVYK